MLALDPHSDLNLNVRRLLDDLDVEADRVFQTLDPDAAARPSRSLARFGEELPSVRRIGDAP